MAKKCPRCGYENAEAMRFCLNCGTALAETPTEAPTESFGGGAPTNFGGGRETETLSRNPPGFPPSYPTVSKAKPKSKIGLIIGGVAALFFLVLMAGAAIVFFNLKSKPVYVANNNSSPTISPTTTVGKSPTPKTSVSPGLSPTPDAVPNPSATPQASFTPPVTATKNGNFTVYANGGWQLSQIDVVPLEQFVTNVQGLVDLAGIKTGVSSNGVIDAGTKSRRIYQEFPTGALLMRTRYADGKYSNVQPVTAPPSKGNWQNFPDELGRLEFCINDNAPDQNGGQFTVGARMTSVPKAK